MLGPNFRQRKPVKDPFTWKPPCTALCTVCLVSPFLCKHTVTTSGSLRCESRWRFIALHSGLPQRASVHFPRRGCCAALNKHHKHACEQHQLSGQTSATNKGIEYRQHTKCFTRLVSALKTKQHTKKNKTPKNLVSSHDGLIDKKTRSHSLILLLSCMAIWQVDTTWSSKLRSTWEVEIAARTRRRCVCAATVAQQVSPLSTAGEIKTPDAAETKLNFSVNVFRESAACTVHSE